jgi:hypothetical protein
MRTTREGPQRGDPQGGSSEGTQRGNGRRPGRRQNAGGSRGGGRYEPPQEAGGRYRRPLQDAGGRDKNMFFFFITALCSGYSPTDSNARLGLQKRCVTAVVVTQPLTPASVGEWPFRVSSALIKTPRLRSSLGVELR